MNTIDLETARQLHSPLQAAREWRGISLVAAARESGLPVGQAEALEEGTIEAFGSAREMIGAAVVYGASLGIGRDEAGLRAALATFAAPAPAAVLDRASVEAANLALVSTAVLTAALARRRSVGCHVRTDEPLATSDDQTNDDTTHEKIALDERNRVAV